MLITISLNQTMKAYKKAGLDLHSFPAQYILSVVYDEYVQTGNRSAFNAATRIIRECYPLVTGEDFINAYNNF